MVKPIKDNPIIKGKAAKKFKIMFLNESAPNQEKIEQNKKDVQAFLSARMN